MSSNAWIVQAPETSVAANTVQTILQVKAAGTNLRERLNTCKISVRGGASGDAPVLVELLRQSSAGTASTVTPSKLNPDAGETLQLTAQKAFSAEPTAGAVLDYRYLSPIQGEVQFSPKADIPAGGYVGVRVTTQSGVTAITAKAEMQGDE